MLPEFTVIISGVRPPRVSRRCPRCQKCTWFASSGKFRINAQKKKLDAWLIYRCCECERTWNRTVFERQDVNKIDREFLGRLTTNDAELAREVSNDTPNLRQLGMIAEDDGPFALQRLDHENSASMIGKFCLRIETAGHAKFRTDRILAQALGVSRSRLQKLVASSAIQIETAQLRRSLDALLVVVCEIEE